jgi:hypothetical protein
MEPYCSLVRTLGYGTVLQSGTDTALWNRTAAWYGHWVMEPYCSLVRTFSDLPNSYFTVGPAQVRF